MANSLSFTQSATILNSLLTQAQGKAQIVAVDETQFVAQAQIALQMGYEPTLNSLSQILSRTVFSSREYKRKLNGLYADSVRYGNHVRKISPIDGEFEHDSRVDLVDGQSIDPWTVNKPKALQMNWYGENVYQVSLTLFKDQLDTAFSSSAEFGSFVSMVLQNVLDMIEQKHEVTARATLANLIAGKAAADTTNVIHLISEYKTEKGITDPTFNYRAPANFPEFSRWLFGFIETLSDRLTERGILYHMNVTDKEINRHTPKSSQVMYLYGPLLNAIKTEVKSVTFNEELLSLIDFEKLNYWQSPSDPMAINVKPNYINSAGELVNADTAIEVNNIFGVIFDRDCAGYTVVNTWSQSTPMNAKGGYTNTFWHFTDRPWLDLTENAVVLLLDETGDTTSVDPLTVTPKAGSATMYGHKVNTFQTNVVVNGDKITGTLKYVAGGLAETGPLAGSGYFLALGWSDPTETVTSLKVGLVPSQGTGLVECLADTDRDGVFKIRDNDQTLLIQQTTATGVTTQVFDLTGLVLQN